MKSLKRVKEEDNNSNTNEPTMKKTRRMTSSQSLDHFRICQDLFDFMRNYKLADGRLLCDGFLRAPSKKLLPQYHLIVTNPMDLARVQMKMKNYEYTNVDQMAADVKLLVDNAKNFYKKNAPEYKDACELWNIFMDQKTKLTEINDSISEASCGRSDNSSPGPSNRSLRSSSPRSSVRGRESSPGRLATGSGAELTDLWILEQFLASVLTVNDEKGRRVCHPFVVLPSREEFPDYYRVIKNPIDLKMVAERLRSNSYRSLRDLEHDLNSMCKNAKRYNEPGSLIYKDANFLKRFAVAKKGEFLNLGAHGIGKIKTPNAAQLIDDLLCFSHPSGHGANVSNALEEDSEDEDTKFVPDDKFSALYTAIRYAKDDEEKKHGAKPNMDLIEPFLRLPSKSFYPDYYDEIKQPMSLFIINRKIKMDEYNNFEEMVADMNLMFNNAKSYNVEGSIIYTNANKLQHICNVKVQKLDPSIDASQYVLDIPCDTSSFGGENDDSTTSSATFADFYQKTSPPPSVMSGGPASSLQQSDCVLAKLKLKRTTSPGSANAAGKQRGRPGRKSMDELMIRYKDKLLMLYKTIVEQKDQYGRILAAAFMEKPSKKVYPSYYTIIELPMDLQTINSKIMMDTYESADQMAADVTLMLNNAKNFNEENSKIFNDAVAIGKAFSDAMRQLGPTPVESPKMLKNKFGWNKPTPVVGGSMTSPGGAARSTRGDCSSPRKTPSGSAASTPKAKAATRWKKQMALYQAVRDYVDAKGRQLSNIFIKLPLKTDYPDYYEIIKKPIDMQKIHGRITSNNLYPDLDALAQDFMLMFDNACKYNDPESTIYKDALSLQKFVLLKKNEMMESEFTDRAPDVHAALQEMMTNIFISVYNFQDPEGRCYSDSFVEFADLVKDKAENQSTLCFDEIKRNIDRFRYRRLDRFQQDMFDIFDKARKYSSPASEIFEDSVELQKHFIDARDEICHRGKLYSSPALKFSHPELQQIVDQIRALKKAAEKPEADDERSAPSKRKEGDTDLESLDINGLTFKKHDFVYIRQNEEEKILPHIMRVERIWRDSSGDDVFIAGNWFYRPYETFHLATRKFLEKEVFKTEIYDTVDADRLIGKCCVFFTRDYVKYSAKDLDEKDLYCCNTRYLGRMKHSFQIMTHWCYDMTKESYELAERTEPLQLERFASVFVSGATNKDNLVAAISPPPSLSAANTVQDKEFCIEEEDFTFLDTQRQDVLVTRVDEPIENGAIYYEHLDCGNGMWLKLGDGVYLRGDKQLPDIVRVEKLWKKDSGIYLSGLWFARPQDVDLDTDRLCYKKELFAAKRIEGASLAGVLSKCLVLSYEDYQSKRIVDTVEEHVFVCQSSASLAKDKKLPPGGAGPAQLSMYKVMPISLSDAVLADEIYYFKRPIAPEKVNIAWFTKEENILFQSVICELGSIINHLDLNDTSLVKTIPKLGARSKSGYILFSAVIRKKVMRENPDCPFGQISKLVGSGWKRLSDFEKKRFDEEADKIAQARAKADLAEGKNRLFVPPGQIRVWMCKWRKCDYQFETADQLQDHITNFHTSQIIEGGEKQYICLWQTCTKYRKDGKTFPSLPRLNRHMREKHVQVQASSKCILPQNVGSNFVPANTMLNACDPNAMNAYEYTPNKSIINQQQVSKLKQQQNNQFQNQMIGQQQALRFQTPPPQQIHASNPVMVDGQCHVLPGGQQYNVYQIQQQPVVQQITAAHPVQQAVADQHQINVYQQKPVDPGRTVVQRASEPVFVVPPQRVQRVLHSEVYAKYLETLNQQQPEPTVSRWDRYLAANAQNTKSTEPLPEHFIDRSVRIGNKEELSQTLWNLRNHMMNDNLQMYRFLNLSEI